MLDQFYDVVFFLEAFKQLAWLLGTQLASPCTRNILYTLLPYSHFEME